MKVTTPKLPPVLVEIAVADFVSEASLEACRLTNFDLTGTDARIISLDEVRLEKVVLAEAKLQKLTGRDVIAKNCDFSATDCAESSFQRAAFEGGRMTGLDCSKGIFKDVAFTGCKLDMANFRFCKMTSVTFKDCLLTDADFLGAELKDVSFESCLLERTEFTHSKLKNIDLRSSELIDLKGWQYLKGAIIDGVQLMTAAPYLANELGIKVAD
jgi:uncharacterized protein YjbI with pentapeptide repeats